MKLLPPWFGLRGTPISLTLRVLGGWVSSQLRPTHSRKMRKFRTIIALFIHCWTTFIDGVRKSTFVTPFCWLLAGWSWFLALVLARRFMRVVVGSYCNCWRRCWCVVSTRRWISRRRTAGCGVDLVDLVSETSNFCNQVLDRRRIWTTVERHFCCASGFDDRTHDI